MAKKKAGKKRASTKSREVLVVASKVKSYIKDHNMNTSADAINQLSDRVYMMLDEATARTQANGRKTVKAQDI
jgi:hypothetical protein